MKFTHWGRTALLSVVALMLIGAFSVSSAQDDGLLQVTDAFHLTAQPGAPGVIKLHWKIADHYYLYRGRISAKSLDGAVKLGKLNLPNGHKEHDEFLGDVEIYHGSIDATLAYTVAKPGAQTLTVAIQFQGCHEVDPKICYPPYTQKVSLPIPAGAPASVGAALAATTGGKDTQASATSSNATVAAEAAPATAGRPRGIKAGMSTGNPGSAMLPARGNNASMDTSDTALPPEQAFRFEAIASAPDRLLLRWTMPKDYYLYRDKTALKVVGGKGISLGKPQWPDGVALHDDNFGDSIVYFGEVDVPVAVKRAAGAADNFTLEADFQGCKRHGICYPVMTRKIKVSLRSTANSPVPKGLPAVVGAASAATAGGEETTTPASSFNARVAATAAPTTAGSPRGTQPTSAASGQSAEQKLAGGLAGNGRWLVLLGFFAAGLGLAFTPCVLPMIPILSGLIAGAGEKVSTGRAFVLSVVYVLASSVVFVIAGAFAGLAGASLQAAFQTPWILWCFAILFVLLALSMFGFYELQLPPSWQTRLAGVSNRQKSGSLVGVAIMGVLSALIVGPCVAPPLAGAVLYIAQSHNPVFGGLALFLLSLGMGVPLVIFGVAAGKWLPRSGGWMNVVKAVFGVIFLGLAIWMLSRILDTLWIMLMTGALLVASAVYMGALERIVAGASGWRRLWKALGVILLIVGAAELIGAAAGSQDLLKPLSGISAGQGTVASAPKLGWRTIKSVDDLNRAVAAASAAGQPLLLDFQADWCVSCKEMEKFTFADPKVQQALSGFVLLHADVTANDAADKALFKHFGLFGPPATIFYAADGKELRGLRLIGFENADAFAARVDKAER